MRPETIDDVLLAYEMAVRELRQREGRMRMTAARLEQERAAVEAQKSLVRSLREDTRAALDTEVAA